MATLSRFENIQKATQPDNLNIQLFPHQLASICQMERLELDKKVEVDNKIKETSVGFFTEETGSGKTLSIIGLLCIDKMSWDMDMPYTVDNISTIGNEIVEHNYMRYDRIDCNLILVSNSIIHQWETEIRHSNLKYILLNSSRLIENLDRLNEYDIALTTPTYFNRIMIKYKHLAWKRFIFDEPGHIRVPGMKNIIAGFYWFVTATPEAIYYNHRNCKKTFMEKFIDPCRFEYFKDVYKGLVIQNDPEFIKESFTLPETTYINHKCHQGLYNIVRGLIPDSINTYVECGNIEGAILALGGTKTSNLVELLKQKMKEELSILKSKINIYKIRNEKDKITRAENKYNKILRQIELLEDRFNNALNEKCPICCDKIEDPILEPSCQNIFCGKCIIEWLKIKNTCPICRERVNMNELVYISVDKKECDKKEVKEVIKMKTKSEKIKEIIEGRLEGKFLIFSRYETSFNTIRKILEEMNIRYKIMKGSATVRKHIIKEYKEGDLNVIFLNSDYDGAGINLQETTDIILYHEMPVYYIKQIVGRANRIGRKQPLNVHTLVLDKNCC